ncbi:MAG: DVUA0089 family protein [Pseudomonadota bacterium]
MARLHLNSCAIVAALTAFASPALAQGNICGGFGDNGIWIGGDEGNSDIASADTYREQMALVLGGNDYVSLFTLTAPTSVRVEAEGRGSGDPVIDLLDETGGIILSDDDSGGNAASRAEAFLEAGTYCMSMRSYDGGPMTAFVRIGREEHEPLTDGIDTAGVSGVTGSCAEAVQLGGIGSTATASANETPFWQFTLDAPTALTIRAENENADPLITLYDSAENYLTENDDFDGLNAQIDMVNPLDAGNYCLEVSALSDDSAPITVSLSAYDPEAALQALYDTGEAAPPLDGTVATTNLGALTTRLRQDVQATQDVTWFTMDIDEPGLMLVEAIGSAGSDPWLVVYDDLGREVGLNDDYGDGLDSLIAARVETGTYIIGVKLFDGSQGLIRLVAERYVRAQ